MEICSRETESKKTRIKQQESWLENGRRILWEREEIRVNRTQKTMRNSMVGLIGQVVAILLSFISRKVNIQYLGVELMGLNSTFTSILNTLSLAELGFQRVIVFHLYGVLAKDDQEQINALVNIYRLVFRCIGCFFILASLCCLPLLQYFLSDIEVTNRVRLYFLIQALNGACTYFLAYKRNILYADQQNYVSSLIDTVVNTVGTLTAIAVAVFTRDFALFLLVGLAKSYISNLFVHIACTRCSRSPKTPRTFSCSSSPLRNTTKRPQSCASS